MATIKDKILALLKKNAEIEKVRPLCDLDRQVTFDPAPAFSSSTYRVHAGGSAVTAVSTAQPGLFGAACQIFNSIKPGSAPEVLCFDAENEIVIVEDQDGFKSNLEQMISAGEVEPNTVCQTARVMAEVHKVTKRSSMSEEEHTRMCETLGESPHKADMSDAMFVKPFSQALLTDQRLSEKIRPMLQRLQAGHVTNMIQDLKQQYDSSRECLLHGSLRPSSIIVNAPHSKLVELSGCCLGPPAFDLGVLLAHYVIWYHRHMLTPEDNDSHRQVSYRLNTAITDTGHEYARMMGEDFNGANFFHQVAGYAGCEIVRMVLSEESTIPPSPARESLASAERLLSVRSPVDSVGRFAMIALALC